MSLWTPQGEHPVDPTSGDPAPSRPATASAAAADAGPGDEEDEAVAARLEQLRNELASTPVEIVVANHAYGLFELAALHLSDKPARLDQARLAIDALGALVEGLSGRLGGAETSLQEALAQIRMAYVEISQTAAAGDGGSPPAAGDAPDSP